MILVVIYMTLLYGEFMFMLSLFGLRKSQISHLGILYIGTLVAVVLWEVYKSQKKA